MIVSMCPACLHTYLQNHVKVFHQIFVHVASDRGSVLYRRHCNTLCTSSFVEDDTSSSSRRKGAISVAEQYRTAHLPIMGRVTHFNIGAECLVYTCVRVKTDNSKKLQCNITRPFRILYRIMRSYLILVTCKLSKPRKANCCK